MNDFNCTRISTLKYEDYPKENPFKSLKYFVVLDTSYGVQVI